MSSLKSRVFGIFWLWSNLIKFVYANHQAKHLLVSECEYGPTRQVFIRCNITPLIGNSNTNGNYWMWWNFWLNPKLLPVRLILAPKSKTMRSLKRKSPARKSMCVPHSALLSGKHPRPLLEQHSTTHTHALCDILFKVLAQALPLSAFVRIPTCFQHICHCSLTRCLQPVILWEAQTDGACWAR